MTANSSQSLGHVMESEIAEIPKVFESLLASIDQFNQVAKLLTETLITSVQVLARGTSDNAAHFLKYLIETHLGLPVGLASPSSVTIYHSKLQFKGTLVIALSQSGQSTDLVEYAKSAKIGGAKLVTLTNDAVSPLAKLSDAHISLMAGPEYAVAATKSYAAQLFASLLLVRAWGIEIPDLDSIVSESRKTLTLIPGVLQAVARFERSHEIVIVGRGFAYPNAREMALKIQETSKVSVQGLSIADYMHGPISALTDKSQVIVLAPNGISHAYLANDISKIRAASPEICWLGSDESAVKGDYVIPGAECESEILSSICDTILLQTFALEFARKNQLDPDSPVGLSKVTFTR